MHAFQHNKYGNSEYQKFRATTRIEAEAYLAESIAGLHDRKMFSFEILSYHSISERKLGWEMMNKLININFPNKILYREPEGGFLAIFKIKNYK